MGFASGIYTTALGIGLSLGLLTGPFFGGWKLAFICTGILTLAVAILWALFARNAPKGTKIHMSPMISSIRRGIKSKNIWLSGIMMFLSFGVLVAFSGNFPKALESIHHVNPKMAGSISSLFTFGIVAGNFFTSKLSDKVGFRKPFIYICAVTSAICLFFAWHLAPRTSSLALTFFGGYALGGMSPILFAIPVELSEIGHDYVGGASGIMLSLGNMGGFLIPFMVMSPLIAAGTLKAYNNGFLVILILLAAVASVAIPLMETGIKAKFRK